MALSTHEEKQSKTFYETLQSSPTLDLRDKQGNIVSWMCEKNISINAGGFAQLNSVIQAKRTRTDIKTGKCSHETSYYISNCIIAHTDHAKQIYGRIRNHWAIETNNHIRDVTLK